MAFAMRSVAVMVAIAWPVDAGFLDLLDHAAAQSLHTLDLKRDGLVDSSEVTAFAKTQGNNGAPTSQEFVGSDAKHDGSLDMMEFSSALSSDAGAPKVQLVQIAASSVIGSHLAASTVEDAPQTPATSTALLADGAPQTSGRQNHAEPDAQAAASLIARELSIQATKEKDARILDREAAEMRANSTAITRQTVQRVLEAGSKAASRETTQLLQLLTKLEGEAAQAEVQAAALRAKSRAELEQASDFMTIANAALGTPSLGA